MLGSGPADHDPRFIERVNRERISLKNLYVFQMDECLDWEGRKYPLGVHKMSCEGRMRAQFYDQIDPELNVPESQRIWPTLEDLDGPDRLCEQLGGIDTVWAGVGYKGLVANNETPLDPYQRVTLNNTPTRARAWCTAHRIISSSTASGILGAATTCATP